jgi:acyl-coenzyme A thioesterase PaaI-like protein
MIDVAPDLRCYISDEDITDRRRILRRCAGLVRDLSRRLIDCDLPSDLLVGLEGLLISARDALAVSDSRADMTAVPSSELHPWVGPSNPVAPPMRFHLEDDVLVGLVQCSELYGGTVERVHGGVIAGLFDAVIATRGALSGASTTARLVINYRLPVPLHQTLRMEAVVDRMDGRKCHMSARMLDRKVLLAEATALTVASRS